MGITVDHRRFRESAPGSFLTICGPDAVKHFPDAYSINRPLAEKLLAVRPQLRTMQLESCFRAVVDTLPAGAVIRDIDVMFNPAYKVDVLKVLIAANKQKPIRVIWPGRYGNGRLIYSEETLPDYKVYEISDYDICVVV